MIRRFEYQQSLICSYGKKGEHLEYFIRKCQDIISKKLLSKFYPYEIDQVHGTIIGLEVIIQNNKLINKNFMENEISIEMDFDSILSFIKDTFSSLHFEVQLGGYKTQKKYDFDEKVNPYMQSFSIKRKGAIAKGWPIIRENGNNQYSNCLDKIRKEFQEVHILHKYHREKDSFDNDFFFVLGKVDYVNLSKSQIKEVEEDLRLFISGIEPIYIPITKENLSLAFYVDSKMPLDTTSQVLLNSEQFESLNKEQIENWIYNGT